MRPITRLCWTALAVFFLILRAAPAGAQTLTITSAPYNASTGSADNSTAIQAAINALGSGGTVVIPAGNFLSGSITLKSNMTLQLSAGATLQMTAMGTFPPNTDFVYGSKLTNVIIDGSGVMDGQGQAWWTAFNNGGTDNRPPAMIELTGCTGVTVSGISVINSPKFHIQFLGNGVNVTASGLTITAPWPSPNTDGIDLRGTNVNILNCYISDGDDVVQIGGSNACSGVTVSGCTFGTGHGLSIGSITSGNVSNVLVNNCVFNGTQYGLRLKSNNTEGGVTSNVTYSNITMSNIMVNPILMYSYYPDVPTSPTTDTGSAANSTTPYWQNIKFQNVVASEATTGKANVGILWGLPQAPVSNVSFDACTLTGAKIMEVFNTQGVTFNCNCLINGLAPSNTAAVTTYNAAMAGTDNVDFAACGPSPTFTAVVATATRTRTPTATMTATVTLTKTPTVTATKTPTVALTATRTPTASPTSTASATASFTKTVTSTASPTATVTATRTSSPTASVTPTKTSTPAFTPTATASVTKTLTATPTASSTPTSVFTGTFSPTKTITATPTSSATPTVTSSWTQTPVFTSSATTSPTATPSVTSTATAALTSTKTQTATATAPFTQTATATMTSSPTAAWTSSPTGTSTATQTAGSSATASSSPTKTMTFTPTPTLSATVTPSKTATALPPTLTFSPTATLTLTPTATPSSTMTPLSTATMTTTATFSAGEPPISKPIPFPNPVRGGTVQIHFVLAIASPDVKIRIFTTAFRKVMTVDLGPLPAGVNEPSITLLDERNRPLANGLYYVEVSDSQGTAIGKLLVQR